MLVDPKKQWDLAPTNSIWHTQPDWRRVARTGKKGKPYYVVKCPGHPRAWSNGRVYVHVLVAEQKLGRFLRPEEVVHHADGNTLNNHLSNITVLANAIEHGRCHHQEQWLWNCEECGTEFPRKRSRVVRHVHHFCSQSCSGKYTRRNQLLQGTGPKRMSLEEHKYRKMLYMRKWRKAIRKHSNL